MTKEVSVDIKTLSPGGSLSSAPWLYTSITINREKNCIKSDFKEIFFLNRQQMGKVIRPFC